MIFCQKIVKLATSTSYKIGKALKLFLPNVWVYIDSMLRRNLQLFFRPLFDMRMMTIDS